MRVLHINCNYMTTVLHQTMVEHLDKTGVESHVFAPVYDAGRAVIRPRDNVTVSECFNKWDRLHFGYKQRKIARGLQQAVDVSTFDCLHAYTLFTDGNCAMRMSEKYGIPFVVAVRSTDMNDFFRYRPWLRGLGMRIMQRASVVFFLSQRYMDDMLNKYVPPNMREELRQKSRVVPNGIDDFWLQNPPPAKEPSKDGTARIIVAGRVNRNKNQITLMQAVDKLNAEGFPAHLTVVGQVENEAVLTALHASTSVTYHPACPKEELVHLYRKNDLFVLPSFQETFGLVYAEAMSQGLPVLYTRGEGFDGQFPEGTVGYAVDPHSAENIAKTIRTAWDTKEVLAQNGPALAKQFNWDDIVSGYKTVYETIV